METKYFNQINSQQELNTRAQLLKDLLDLDNPVNQTLRQEVAGEYNQLLSSFQQPKSEPAQKNRELSHQEVIQALKKIDVRVEVCGKWIWVHGDTKPHRDFLKSMRLRFSPDKKCWYWRPDKYRSINTEPISMAEIRDKYGSEAV